MFGKQGKFELIRKLDEYQKMRDQQAFSSEKFNNKVKINQSSHHWSKKKIGFESVTETKNSEPALKVEERQKNTNEENTGGEPMNVEEISPIDQNARIDDDEVDQKKSEYSGCIEVQNSSLKRFSPEVGTLGSEITKPTTRVLTKQAQSTNSHFPNKEYHPSVNIYCSPPQKSKKHVARQSLPADLNQVADNSIEADLDVTTFMDESLRKLCPDEKELVKIQCSEYKNEYSRFERKSCEFLRRYHSQRLVAMHREDYISLRAEKTEDKEERAKRLDELYQKIVDLYAVVTQESFTAQTITVEEVRKEFIRMDCVGWRVSELSNLLNDYF